MTDAAFLLAVWLAFCAMSVLVWRVGRAFRRPFDMPLAYALTMTGLAVVRNAADSTRGGLILSIVVCFGLYYGSAWLVRFVWRLGLGMWRDLRRAGEAARSNFELQL